MNCYKIENILELKDIFSDDDLYQVAGSKNSCNTEQKLPCVVLR